MPANTSRNTETAPFLRLRLSSLLALAFLGVAAIALAYVGGVMTGRASVSAERRLAAVERAQGHAPVPPGEAGLARAPETPEDRPGILSPEELRFARALRNEEGAPESQPAPLRPGAPAQPPAVAAQAPDQPAAQLPAQGAGAPGTPLLPAGEAPPAQAPPQAGSMQDYVFQMGAFRDEDSVDSLRQRLEGRGLRTRMQREGKLYVVLVLLRGDAARAEEVIQIAEELRLGMPLLKSRKPVSP